MHPLFRMTLVSIIVFVVYSDVSVGQNTFRIGVLANETSLLSIADSIVAEAFEAASYEAISVEEVEMYDTLGHHFLILYCRSTITGAVTVSFKLRPESENDITYLALVDDQRSVRFFSTKKFIDNIKRVLKSDGKY